MDEARTDRDDLPAYRPPPAPLELAGGTAARRGLPVAARVGIGVVIMLLGLALVGTVFSMAIIGLERYVEQGLPIQSLESDPYYDDSYEQPAPRRSAPVPATLAKQIEREFATFEAGASYVVEDSNHPGVPVYDVELVHREHPEVSAIVHFWAPEGTADEGTVGEWGVKFPFFGTGEGSHPLSEQLVTYVAETPSEGKMATGAFGSCRQTGEWGDVQAWTCEWVYEVGYSSGQEVFYVNTVSGAWSRERPVDTVAP